MGENVQDLFSAATSDLFVLKKRSFHPDKLGEVPVEQRYDKQERQAQKYTRMQSRVRCKQRYGVKKRRRDRHDGSNLGVLDNTTSENDHKKHQVKFRFRIAVSN